MSQRRTRLVVGLLIVVACSLWDGFRLPQLIAQGYDCIFGCDPVRACARIDQTGKCLCTVSSQPTCAPCCTNHKKDADQMCGHADASKTCVSTGGFPKGGVKITVRVAYNSCQCTACSNVDYRGSVLYEAGFIPVTFTIDGIRSDCVPKGSKKQ